MLFDPLKTQNISVPFKAVFSLENIRDAHREWGMGSIVIKVRELAILGNAVG
jgi:hypothetical protein